MHRLPEKLLILVCDSRKALFLRNVGSPIQPKLEVLQHQETDGFPQDAEASDRAGRRFDGDPAGGSFQSRSAMEQDDLGHRQATSFAGQIDTRLQELIREHEIDQIAIAAPPSFLGVLREEFSTEVARIVTSETPKRLTDVHVDEIAAAFLDYDKSD